MRSTQMPGSSRKLLPPRQRSLSISGQVQSGFEKATACAELESDRQQHAAIEGSFLS